MIRLYEKKVLIGAGVLVLLAIIVIVAVYFATSRESNTMDDSKFISDSYLGIYKTAAVVTNGPECAKIGSDILEHKNGTAVDAAIAALLCEGIASLHSMGLGGGFLMTIYDAKTQKATFLDARETAPKLANETMFGGNATLSFAGGLSVAVPGELMGYWEVHQKYGRVPWKDLFEPAIKLCENGNIINKYLYNSLKGKEKYIREEETLREILINSETNMLYAEGELIKRPKLAETLRKLANAPNPVDLFYKGDMAKQLVAEIKGFKGIITEEDFANYKVQWREPTVAKLGKITMYSAPPPGSGVLLTFMLNVLEKLLPANDTNILWQRIIETFKWAYAKRTLLGDPAFENITEVIANLTSKEYADKIRLKIKDNKTYQDPKFYGANTTNRETHGTAHVSVLAPDGSAVSVTSTINQVLGAKIRSKSTGIIFNDEMDDFSAPNITNAFDVPPSPANFIKPNKRPLSSMSPTILVDEDNKVKLVIGAAGGTKITTAVASIIVLHLWNGYNIKEAIDTHRLHHQLFPMVIQNEKNFPQSVLQYLHNIGHNVTTFSGIGSAVTGISNNNGQIMANSDYRRLGRTAGF
ncbi:scoloptoxin SSD14-like [Phymastichus coffea]|uniref:scoloptoxin SSD14-like n=1 Tax=Phymastichus coffea TaxID=108790 RepID=UPI00273A7CD0|nr:scoloptoxin SSD14-like [Phymastichus coffea]